jgi:acetyl-CoA carboxylase carboxyltransferase component
MGPDGAVNIIHRAVLDAIDDERKRKAKRLELAEEIRANIDPYIAAGHAQLDDVIDPAETAGRDHPPACRSRAEKRSRRHGGRKAGRLAGLTSRIRFIG